MIGPDELLDDLGVALRLAEHAAGVIRPHFRRCAVDLKPDGSEVTAADLAAEQAIRDRLARERPDDGILGEEFGDQGPRAGNDRRWLIDPIDGTAFFSLGLPLYSTLIALLDGDEPALGVIHLPSTGETTYAARGHGCWWRLDAESAPERLRVDESVRSLDVAIVSAGHAQSSDIRAADGQAPYRLARVIRSSRDFRFAGDSVKYPLLCRGRLHVAVDTIMFPWDIAALVPCVEEAGGIVSSLDGTRDRVVFGGTLLGSCHAGLHDEVLTALSPARGAGD